MPNFHLRDLLTLDFSAYERRLHRALAQWQVHWWSVDCILSLDPEADESWIFALAEFRIQTRDPLTRLSGTQRELLVGREAPGLNTHFFGGLQRAKHVTEVLRDPDQFPAKVAQIEASRSGARGLGTRPTVAEAIGHWKRINDLHAFGPATASRLLLAERPDLYFMLNGPSRDGMERITGHALPQVLTHANGPAHYAAMLEQIYRAPWWTEERPREPRRAVVWDARVALLDVFAYDPNYRASP